MADPINTTLPIELRRELVPILRYSNYGGPGYAGRLGNETLLVHADINQGNPILVGELTRTPQGLAQVMKVALQTEPNGYLDSVTRNHDVEYTVAEIRFMNKVQANFEGRLPDQLTAEDMATPAFKQLVVERNQEYWAADKRMLNAAADYQPTDFADASYRALMVQGFYVKAGDDALGGEYGIPRAELNGFFDTLKARDPGLATPDSLLDKLGTLSDAGNLARSDFEALVTLPLTPQERAFFNPHLSPDSTVVPSEVDAQGNFLQYDQRDFGRSIVVPFRTTDNENIFLARVRIGDREITSVLDKSDKGTPVFTSETRINGELVSTTTKIALPQSDDELGRQGQFGVRAYQVEVRDGSGNLQQSYVQEKPAVPDLTVSKDLEAKLHAVRTGNYDEVVPEIHSNPFSNAYQDGAHGAPNPPPPVPQTSSPEADLPSDTPDDDAVVSGSGSESPPGQCTPDDPDTAALTPDQVAAADANSASSSATLDSVLPYAAGLNSALSLIQALEQGNTLSAVMAGAGLANTLNHLTDGAIPALPGELAFGLNALSTGLNLLDALDNGDTLGALTAGTNLASQAAGLWANASANIAFDAIEAGGMNLAAETAAAEMGALSQSLGQIAGALGVLNSLANGDPLGAVSGLLMMNPATAPIGIALSIGRALFGGLFGDDDGGEPPYIIVKASGDAHFVRHDDGSIGIESSGTNQHKSTEGTAVGAGTQGGQAVASALGALLADLQSQVDAHNAAHPEATFALVPERLPQLHWRDPAYYAEWTDAASGEPRSIAVSGRDLAGDLLAVAQSGAAVVPAWLAETITQRIEAGDTAAWRPAPTPEAAGDTQAQAILVLGSGAMDQVARSDIDADGWSEAHAWSANNLYLTVDSNGDGQIEGLRDLVTLDGEAHAPNRLGWLDADGNGLLDSNDPGFAALKLWLDANGDAVAQDGESAGLQAAGIVAIDFHSYPPALVDAAGNATALTETQLTGDTKGIRTAQTDSGIQVAVEDGETVLLATRTTDYTGDEAHTHREEIAVGGQASHTQRSDATNDANWRMLA